MPKKIVLAAAAMMGLSTMATAQGFSEEQLIEYALQQGSCGEGVPVGATMEGARVRLTCAPQATGFVPAIGALGAGTGAAAAAAAAGLAAVAAGGGGSTPSTTN